MTCGIVNLGALFERTRRLDALVQVTVQSAALTTPPGSPIEGQRWILPAARTGAWTGHAGQIAAWQDGAWSFYAPLDGWTAIDISTDTLLHYSAGTGSWTGLITGVFSDAAFTLQDDIDLTKQARFQIAGFTAGAVRVFTLPDVSSSVAVLSGVAQTDRGGSVCLNRFRAFLKWISALIMLPPEPATAG